MNQKSYKFPLLALGCVALLATQPGAGCVDTTTTTNGQTTSHRQVDGNLNDGDTNDNDPNWIPRRADIVAEGKGPLSYVADADGDVYVQDLKDETLVVTHRMHRGEKVEVLPDDNRVKLEGDSIYKDDLKKDHTHRIYLLRDGRFDDRYRDHRDDRYDHRNDHRNDDRADSGDRAERNGVRINVKDKGPYSEVGIPSDAQLMDQGMNREMTFVTSKAGRVYVYDVENNQVVATPQIDARQVFRFAPGNNRILIDDKKLRDYDFDPRSQYRIYFSRR